VDEELADGGYNPDEVRLTSVGIDIGSSTSHLMVSRLVLRRLGKSMYSKWVVVERDRLYESSVLLTPYLPDFSIDAARLGHFINGALREAGYRSEEIDTGVVILTGEAVRRRNARAIAELFADTAGKFVCASAGHQLEATVTAYGSGAIDASRLGPVLNIDVGGGTSKLAYAAGGKLLGTAAVNVGGRLVATAADRTVERIEHAANVVARSLGIELQLGQPLTVEMERSLAGTLADCLAEVLSEPPYSALTEELLLTPPLRGMPRPSRVTLSGGVAEYLNNAATPEYGDIGKTLAGMAIERIERALGLPVQPAGEQLRATVLGLSQFTVQVSGDTVVLPGGDVLPLRNVPVVSVPLEPGADRLRVRDAVGAALARMEAADGPVALAVDWRGTPYFAALQQIALGVCEALDSRVRQGTPVVVSVSQDCALGLGRLLEDLVVGRAPVLCLDGLDVGDFDYLDIGTRMGRRAMVPVVEKSLVFPVVDQSDTELLPVSAG
jgi:ethanolamine utilization protein EutA